MKRLHTICKQNKVYLDDIFFEQTGTIVSINQNEQIALFELKVRLIFCKEYEIPLVFALTLPLSFCALVASKYLLLFLSPSMNSLTSCTTSSALGDWKEYSSAPTVLITTVSVPRLFPLQNRIELICGYVNSSRT